MYPYRIRINDPEIIDVFKKISKYRVTKIEPNMSKKIGHKIPRIIKRDGVFVENGRFGIENPSLFMTYKPAYGKRGGYDFEINTRF